MYNSGPYVDSYKEGLHNSDEKLVNFALRPVPVHNYSIFDTLNKLVKCEIK